MVNTNIIFLPKGPDFVQTKPYPFKFVMVNCYDYYMINLQFDIQHMACKAQYMTQGMWHCGN